MSPKELARIIDERIVDQLNRLYLKQYQRGVVSAIVGNSASVKIEGNTTAYPAIAALGSYRPKVGDKVLLLSIGSSGANYVILGQLDFQNYEWITPTLGNSWVNYDVSVWAAAGYYRDTQNIVRLRGLIKNGSNGVAVFTLPVGYRPSKQILVPVIANNTIGRVDIQADGVVQVNVGTNTFVNLDGITFRAD